MVLDPSGRLYLKGYDESILVVENGGVKNKFHSTGSLSSIFADMLPNTDGIVLLYNPQTDKYDSLNGKEVFPAHNMSGQDLWPWMAGKQLITDKNEKVGVHQKSAIEIKFSGDLDLNDKRILFVGKRMYGFDLKFATAKNLYYSIGINASVTGTKTSPLLVVFNLKV